MCEFLYDEAFIGVSKRAIEMKFRQLIGVMPKGLAQICWLNYLIQLATKSNKIQNPTN